MDPETTAADVSAEAPAAEVPVEVPVETPVKSPLPDIEDEGIVQVEVRVREPEAVSLVYEGTAPLEMELDTLRVMVWPGALLRLPVIGPVKTLVSEGVLRRL